MQSTENKERAHLAQLPKELLQLFRFAGRRAVPQREGVSLNLEEQTRSLSQLRDTQPHSRAKY